MRRPRLCRGAGDAEYCSQCLCMDMCIVMCMGHVIDEQAAPVQVLVMLSTAAVDMCIGMCVDMCIDMRIHICIEMGIQTCIKMRVYMYLDLCTER